MAKFAPVGPVHILREILDAGEFREYHLLLAHHTMERAEEFTSLINDYHSGRYGAYNPATIIMDNSIVELGGAVEDDLIRKAVETIKTGSSDATVIPVLPDVMGDGLQTRLASAEAYERWIDDQMPGDGFMLVTQGPTFVDFAALVDFFFIHFREDFKLINWVGIPRKLVSSLSDHSRARAVRYIQTVAPHVKIHLLGFSEDIHDDILCASLPAVTGIDSAVPIRYDGVLTPMTTEEEVGPRGNWFEEGHMTQQTFRNLRNIRNWVGQYR